MLQILKSEQDASVNFVEQRPVGYLESRYVRRGSDYFICYLSSQTGCNRGCRFCHLTTTRQTLSEDASIHQMTTQAIDVLNYYVSLKQPAKYMHYNFMSRGEPLASSVMLSDGDKVLSELGSIAHSIAGLPSKVNISTIMPATLRRSLIDVFRYTQPTLYYSMYSTDEAVRKRWLPGAMPYGAALDLLKDYQQFTGKSIKIHFAFIENQNDSEDNLASIVSELKSRSLDVSFNIVRYNPPDDSSRETPEELIRRNAAWLNNHFPTQIVSRVGFDVKASCGMFVEKHE